MEDVTIDEIMEEGGGADIDRKLSQNLTSFLLEYLCQFFCQLQFLVDELKRGVAKKKGRGFGDNDIQKDRTKAFDSLDDDGSRGPQRSVEVNFLKIFTI